MSHPDDPQAALPPAIAAALRDMRNPALPGATRQSHQEQNEPPKRREKQQSEKPAPPKLRIKTCELVCSLRPRRSPR
jgi:hypothetical protein